MIDYLEEVLEEEREETLSQSRRVAVRPRSGRPAGEPGTESAAAAGAGAEDRGEARAAPAPAEDGETAPGEIAAVEAPEDARGSSWGDWLPRTEGETGAASALLGALARTARSVRAIRGSAGVMTVTLPPAERPANRGVDVEALDLAVQRDARRYDGGFELY